MPISATHSFPVCKRPGGARDGLNRLPREPGERARQARPEQRIDDRTGAVNDVRVHRLDLAAPLARGFRGVADKCLARTQERKPHGKTALAQDPRRDETIAAIVAWAAGNEDMGAEHTGRGHPVGDRPPRPLHQRDPRRAACNRPPIRFSHFRRRQQCKRRRGFYFACLFIGQIA